MVPLRLQLRKGDEWSPCEASFDGDGSDTNQFRLVIAATPRLEEAKDDDNVVTVVPLHGGLQLTSPMEPDIPGPGLVIGVEQQFWAEQEGLADASVAPSSPKYKSEDGTAWYQISQACQTKFCSSA